MKNNEPILDQDLNDLDQLNHKELEYYKRQMDSIGGELINADSKITLLNRNLKQKNDGFGLLSELLKKIGTDTSVSEIFETTLKYINEHLHINSSLLLTNQEGCFQISSRLGGISNFQGGALNVQAFLNQESDYMLVNRSSEPSLLEAKLREELKIKFFIGVPIYVHGQLSNYLIAARQKEAQPFYPPFNHGDIETFNSIAGFLSSALTNHSLYTSLSEAKKTVEDYNVTLEKRVEESTQTINEKNEKLQEFNTEITNSITYAKRIQNAILPHETTIAKFLPESYIMYLPKDIVAGDFYWLEEYQGLTLFAAADCTGHGVPGALVSVVCHNALNRSVREYNLTKPGAILDKTREMVIDTFSNSDENIKDGMDASLCCYDPKTQILTFSGANNSLYLIRENRDDIVHELKDVVSDTHYLREVKGDRQPVGKYEFGKPFQTHAIQIEKGDQIVIYSDGFADQFGGDNGKKLKYKRFKELLLSFQNDAMASQYQKLSDFFEEWCGDNEQIDDVIVMGVKF